MVYIFACMLFGLTMGNAYKVSVMEKCVLYIRELAVVKQDGVVFVA